MCEGGMDGRVALRCVDRGMGKWGACLVERGERGHGKKGREVRELKPEVSVTPARCPDSKGTRVTASLR